MAFRCSSVFFFFLDIRVASEISLSLKYTVIIVLRYSEKKRMHKRYPNA